MGVHARTSLVAHSNNCVGTQDVGIRLCLLRNGALALGFSTRRNPRHQSKFNKGVVSYLEDSDTLKKTILTAMIVGSITFIATGEAKADPFSLEDNKLALTEELKPKDTTSKKTKTPVKKYVVRQGDTLSSIARAHKTSVKRLFYKNKNIPNPDVLKVNQTIVIPSKGEKLKKRPLGQVYSESPSNTPQRGSGKQCGIKGLNGCLGSVSPYGNCVNEPGVNNPGWGNPIDWEILSLKPSIGATALWTYNHTGVVVGIWDNGDIEVRHQNYGGGQTRFSPTEFRGFR